MTQLASRMQLVKPSPIRQLMALADDPDLISFAAGSPDPALLPAAELGEAYSRALAENSGVALQYADSAGIWRLRQQLAERVFQDGSACGAENILVVQGAQQAMDLAGKLWLNKGDVVITERPTFLGGPIALNPFEPEYRSVHTDENGMDTEHLEEVLRCTPQAKLIYTIPDFHNPTGYTMSVSRRRHIVELAHRYDVMILEDTPYRELRFAEPILPTIKSFDVDHSRVVHIGTFSKTLSPGMRVAWMVADPQIVRQLSLLKLGTDTQTSTVNMTAASLYLDINDYNAHLARIRLAYRAKRDCIIAALHETMPPEITFNSPDGGMFLWLTFPEEVDTESLVSDHLIPEARVAFVPGATFYTDRPERNHGRLGFAALPTERIAEGVRRIAAGYSTLARLS